LEKFEQLLDKVLRSDWSSSALAGLRGKTIVLAMPFKCEKRICLDAFFVSWVNSGNRRALPPAGRILHRLSSKDLQPFVERGITRYRAEYRDSDVFLFREVLDAIVRCDRVLTTPGGSLLMAGRSGVGRRTAVGIAAAMNNMKLFSPKVSRAYGVKQFKTDLKMVCSFDRNGERRDTRPF
jgi:dynein heavy chain 2, cytosolic